MKSENLASRLAIFGDDRNDSKTSRPARELSGSLAEWLGVDYDNQNQTVPEMFAFGTRNRIVFSHPPNLDLMSMKALAIPILFAIGTALCWGCYGPVIGKARHPDKLYSPFKPYVGIGVAYIVFAVLGGLGMMAVLGDSFSFTAEGHSKAGIWGFLGGTLGAWAHSA